jgi:four helix bundle protein
MRRKGEKIKMKKAIKSHRELEVYQMALEGAVRVFKLTQEFPQEERYSLVDQGRRASRSVCANIAEAWRRRRYKGAFVNKLNDSETEAAETQVWMEIAFKCGYIDEEEFNSLYEHYDKIIGKLVRMIDNSNQWIIRS